MILSMVRPWRGKGTSGKGLQGLRACRSRRPPDGGECTAAQGAWIWELANLPANLRPNDGRSESFKSSVVRPQYGVRGPVELVCKRQQCVNVEREEEQG